MRLLTGGVLAVMLTACAGGSSTDPTTGAAPADTSGSLPATPSGPSGHPRTACAAFSYFYADLTTYTPRAVSLLVADAERVQSLARAGRQATDATDLVATVSSSSWASSGNIDAPAVVRMQRDCP